MRRFAAILGVTLAVFGAGQAQAALTAITVEPGDYVKMSFGSQYYVMNGETGGEFGMTVWDSGMNLKGTFYTFCADPTTLMNVGTLYSVNNVTNSNALGYALSDYGKWIYYEYAKNDTLPSESSFIPGHQSAGFTSLVAGAIQEGIWLQLKKNGQTDWPTGWTTYAYDTVSGTAAGNWYSHYLNGDDSSFAAHKNSIAIAQLQLNGVNVQNQMVLTMMTGAGPVPEPATLMVWSVLGAAGWLSLRASRRRA
jgi:hypothetical protein